MRDMGASTDGPVGDQPLGEPTQQQALPTEPGEHREQAHSPGEPSGLPDGAGSPDQIQRKPNRQPPRSCTEGADMEANDDQSSTEETAEKMEETESVSSTTGGSTNCCSTKGSRSRSMRRLA